MMASIGAGRPRLTGVVHLLPLPGAPRWQGDMGAVCDAAARDAEAFAEGGADAIIVENFGDVPFTRKRVAPETVAAMALAAAAVRRVAGGLPIGFNVLRNDALSALGLCAAVGGCFVRVNVLAGAAVTDQGVIEGEAHDVLRRRSSLCPGVAIWADVHVKHASPLGASEIGVMACDTLERGLADALVVSGSGTGRAVAMADLERVRESCPRATILVGSGANEANVRDILRRADGVIVASSVKKDGDLSQPVDRDRVARLASVIGDA